MTGGNGLLLKAMLSTGFKIPKKNILLTIGSYKVRTHVGSGGVEGRVGLEEVGAGYRWPWLPGPGLT